MDSRYLLLFFDQNQLRRPKTIWQLLTAKLTTSTLYGGLRYDLLSYIKTPLEMNALQYEKSLQELIAKGWLKVNEEQYLLTATGLQQKKHFFATHPYLCLTQPGLFAHIDLQLWNARLLLVVQAVSELCHQNAHYYPCVEDVFVQATIKRWFKQIGKENACAIIKESLNEFLKAQDIKQATIFSAQLVGHEFSGFTKQQIAQQFLLSPAEVSFIWSDLASGYAYFLQTHYPKAKVLLDGVFKVNILSASAQETFNLFKQGVSLNQIAQIKKVKVSTVQEHLLNAAILSPDFDFDVFLNKQIRLFLIKHLGSDIDAWNYQKVAEKIDFFRFRLYEIEKSKERNAYGET